MDARAVGGRAAWLVAALLACNDRPADPRESDPLAASEAAEPVTVPAPEPPSVADPDPKREELRVVVVTLDGVRWEDVLGATPETSILAMPNLHRLVAAGGVAFGGAGCEYDVRASGPNFVSLPGYLELFSGHPVECRHNSCAPTESETVLDEVRATAHREADVAVFASWNRYANAVARDKKAIVLSAGARPAPLAAAKEDAKLRAMFEVAGANAGYPGWGDYRADVHTARIALRYLETKTPRLLVIGLGDADEQAHRGDIAGYRRAIARHDEVIGELERTLGRMGPDGARTAVIVTTDHGRSKSLFSHGAAFPESARVFVAAFGAGITHRGVACAPEPLRLAHVAGAMRALLGVDGEAEPGPLADAIVAAAH